MDHYLKSILITALLIPVFLCFIQADAIAVEGRIVQVDRNRVEVALDTMPELKPGYQIELSYTTGAFEILLGLFRVSAIANSSITLEPVSISVPAEIEMKVNLSISAPIPKLVYGAPGTTPITGKILSVNGKQVEIQLMEPGDPKIGDTVAISFEIPGVGPVDLDGEWEVAEINGSRITANPRGDVSKPQAGQSAVVKSTGAGSTVPLSAFQNNTSGTGRDPGNLIQNDVSGMGRDPRELYPDTSGEPASTSARPVEQIFREAMNRLNGEKGYIQDREKARQLLTEAAERGYPPAQTHLGLVYGMGLGVPANQAEASRWYRKASEAGDATGQYNLGVLYANGSGVPKDYDQALHWFSLSARQGDPEAQYNLAIMNHKGMGVPKDSSIALNWMKKAAERGLAPAQFALGQWFDYGIGVETNRSLATSWYQKAARQGYENAQKRLLELGAGW